MNKQTSNFVKQTLISLTTVFLSACVVGPDYQQPTVATPETFAGSSQPEFSSKSVEIAWWQLFKDAQLTALVNETLQHNHDLAAANANLREARALYLQASLNLAPSVTSRASYTDQMRSTGALNNRSFAPRELKLYNTGFDAAAWELDLFGRVQRTMEASNDELEMQEANLKDVTVSLIAEVARNYFGGFKS